MIKIVLLFFFFSILASAQTITPISNLRMNDANGIPVDTGKTFSISGIVTASNNYGTSGPGAVQDLTAGMSIYGSTFVNAVNVGDSVTVTGKLVQYSGLSEFAAGSTAIVHSTGHTFEPEIVTIAQINGQAWNGFEEFESSLLRINNVTINSSGSFAGNTNYTITDATGSMQIRIDADVNIVGTSIPTGKIDIAGILSQFKSAVPYSSGYQLLPRNILDVVTDGSPIILSPVLAANISSSSFSVFFNTARNGNSQVKYGLTASLEMDSVIINDDTTYHAVNISGLLPATLYYYKALSKNSVGTSESVVKTVSTSSNDTTTGTINVYFNFAVDTSVSLPGNYAKGNVDFREKLLNRINSAKYSIDMAVYSFFGMPEIADALVIAKNRGVKIRVVYDNRTTQNSMQTIIDAGIPYIKRTNTAGIMHNKFLVFDARDTVAVNDWLWTGSWNVTSSELTWKNNIVEINDPTITKAYQAEFEEMWGSTTDTPNSSNAKFGAGKSDNTPHYFNIGGKEIRLYFSPSDGTTSKIQSQIMAADKSIYFSLYAYTRDDLAAAMSNRYSAGVTDIKGIMTSVDAASVYSYLHTFADIWPNTGSTLHHKYAVIDASYSDKNPVVITGSHNWSNNAEQDNDENTLLIFDYKIANQYMQEFKKRYNESGGSGFIYLPVNMVSLSANADNGEVTISWITASELNNRGFSIERKNAGNFENIGFVEGMGTTTESNSYSFIDKNVVTGKYIYRIKQVDFDGTSKYSDEIEVSVNIPELFNLNQNYPNPFNPATKISYSVPVKSFVILSVYDALGRKIAVLVNNEAEPGNYNVNFNASGLSSGIYFAKMEAATNGTSFSSVRKMMLVK